MSEPSRKERVVLANLWLQGPSTGLDLVRNSDGKLGRGTVYVHLARLVEKGLVTWEEFDGPHGLPRRIYTAKPPPRPTEGDR